MNVRSIRQSFGVWPPAPRRASGLVAACLTLLFWSAGAIDAEAQIGSSLRNSNASPGRGGKVGQFFTHGEQSYRVVQATDYDSNANYGLEGPVTSSTSITSSVPETMPTTIASTEMFTAPSFDLSSCDSCDGGRHGIYHEACGGSCGGACSSCGACGGAYGCPQCECYVYGSIEALHMRRQNDNCISSSPNYCLAGCDHQMGTRLTLGGVPDCVQGCEVSFLGVFEWDRYGSRTDPNGGIDSYLYAVDPITESQLSAFRNATEQAQIYDSQYWSIEANQTYVGWEVAKLLTGLRYIDYQEDYSILSRNATENGFLRSAVDNRLLGYQLGMDLLYPLCRNTYVDFRGRIGVYANFIDFDLLVENAGSTVVSITNDSTKVAGQFEIGTGIRYEFNRLVAIRGGAELWYLTGVATAADQVDNGIRSRYSVQGNDDFFVAGFNYGIEFRY